MAENKKAVRMKAPADSSGNRDDLFPITSTDEVEDTNSGRRVTEVIRDMFTVGETQPAYPGFWFDTTGNSNENENNTENP